MSDRVGFVCNGAPVEVGVAPGESLLSVLRERLGLVSAKDGCAPQGQGGCCTVLVDGDARLACVTPAVWGGAPALTTARGPASPTPVALPRPLARTRGTQGGGLAPTGRPRAPP